MPWFAWIGIGVVLGGAAVLAFLAWLVKDVQIGGGFNPFK